MLCKFSDPKDSAYIEVIRQISFFAKRAIAKHQRGMAPALPPRSYTMPQRTPAMRSEQSVHHFHHFEQNSRQQHTLHHMPSDEDSLPRADFGHRIECSPPPMFRHPGDHRHSSIPMTQNASQEYERASVPAHVQSPAEIQNPFSTLSLGDQTSEAKFRSRPTQPRNSIFGDDSDVESAEEDNEAVADEENSPFSRLSMFDTVFILDDTRSMTLGATSGSDYPTRWKLLGKSMEAVVNIACDHDPDGVDVHFLKNTTILQKVQNGKEILDKLGEIKKTFKQSITAGPTIMHTVLERVIGPPLRAYRRFHQAQNVGDTSVPEPTPLNLIFVTDGAAVDEEEVEQYIKRVAQELDTLNAPPSFIGIQFVQIGDDQNAAKFLEKLDDQLENLHKIRDVSRQLCLHGYVYVTDVRLRSQMVDTVRWDNNQVYSDEELLEKFVKVLLGAVTRTIDKQSAQK